LVRETARRDETGDAVLEAAKNLGALPDNAIDGVFIAIGDGISLEPGKRASQLRHFRAVYVNRRAAEIAGYSAAEAIGLRAKDVFPPDEMEKMMELHRRRL